jgi:hypothetical protein
MTERGQGDQGMVEGNPREEIDFEYCYPIVAIPTIPEVEIYIKQKLYRVKTTESWMDVSKRLVAEYGVHRGTLFRIFPVDMEIDRLGDDDHAYSFDIVHDLAKDPHGMYSREIGMVDPFGRVDRMVVPMVTDIRAIGMLWRKILDVPDE